MRFMFDNSPVPINQIPSIEEIAWHPVEPRLKLQIFVRNLLHLLWFIPAFLLATSVWLYMDSIEPVGGFQGWTFLFQSSLAIGLLVLTPLLPFRWFVVPIFEVPKRKYAVRLEDLNYQRGLFTTTVSSAPFNRIQHASTQQYFLERMFNLASLEVYTAAGQAVQITGLDPKIARNLRDHVLAQVSQFKQHGESEENLASSDEERDGDLE